MSFPQQTGGVTQIGPYTVQDVLAQGGMGVVYLAHDPRKGHDGVLKLLRVDDAKNRRRLQREARAMASLRHPNVVPLLDAGEHEGDPYLVLPYVQGESLQEHVERKGPLPVNAALDVAVALGQALSAVHALGLVHRDLKPANVLLDARRDGRPLLTDFGLVKSLDGERSQTQSLSVKGRFLGTPGYWPKEQAFGLLEQIGPPADVYALAATLFALLTGTPPRSAETLIEAVRGFDVPVPLLSSLRSDAPDWLDGVLASCFANEPGERPLLDEVVVALRRRCPLGASHSPATAAGHGSRAASGLPGWVLAGAVSALLVTCLGVLWLVAPRRSALPEEVVATEEPLAPRPDRLARGWTALEEHDEELAQRVAEEALLEAHSLADAHLLLGAVHAARGDRVAAVESWGRAQSYGSTGVESRLGALYPDPTLRRLVWLTFVPEAGELAEAAFLAAKLVDEPGLDVQAELVEFDRIAEELRPQLGSLQGEARFRRFVESVRRDVVRGDMLDYSSAENGSLSQVLARKQGSHTTCGYVLLALGPRLGIPLDGVCFPSWFHVRTRDEPPLFANGFDGRVLTLEELEAGFVRRSRGEFSSLPPSVAAPSTRQEILLRLVCVRGTRFKQTGQKRLADLTTEVIRAIAPRGRNPLILRALGQR